VVEESMHPNGDTVNIKTLTHTGASNTTTLKHNVKQGSSSENKAPPLQLNAMDDVFTTEPRAPSETTIPELNANKHLTREPSSLMEAKPSQNCTLDASCCQVELKTHISVLELLSIHANHLLHKAMRSHEKPLLSFELGTLTVKPIHLEIQTNTKPHH
jgi:hypothetical protein